jgi:hypothetical protein
MRRACLVRGLYGGSTSTLIMVRAWVSLLAQLGDYVGLTDKQLLAGCVILIVPEPEIRQACGMG